MLGSYMAASSLIGRPVASEDVDRLRRANATLEETRSSLEFGRGNVASDAIRTDSWSRYRASAARTLSHQWNRQHGGNHDVQHVANSAGAALTFGAGRCGEYSAVSAVLHSSRMAEDEHLHIMSAPGHNWTEVRSGEGDDRSIVIDGWSNGPAILASDSRLASRWGMSVVQLDKNSATDALSRARTLEQTMRQDPEDIQRRIASQVPYAAPVMNWLETQIAYSDRGIAGNGFTSAVHRRLQDGSRATASHAVATARLLGSSPTTLHDDVKRIDETLRTHFDSR